MRVSYQRQVQNETCRIEAYNIFEKMKRFTKKYRQSPREQYTCTQCTKSTNSSHSFLRRGLIQSHTHLRKLHLRAQINLIQNSR